MTNPLMAAAIFTAIVNFMVLIGIVLFRAAGAVLAYPVKRDVSLWEHEVTACLVYVFAVICVNPYSLVLKVM